ncbi:ATP-dependent bile acid permease [Elsinoe australis]|uniref:ATP-dependent bile acid permease n=1 Tax=Elsinoe australis TaxID=40998 RepID=A0A2P8A055_9PEZI|nr:ATP-dependent bile acid permease [Elsinoe australis]
MLGLTEVLRKHIQDVRVHELAESASYRRFVTVRNTFGWMTDDLAPVTTLTILALVSGSRAINPSVAFTTLSLVALLIAPIHESILAIPEALNAVASFDRIEGFLLREDCTSDCDTQIPSSETESRSNTTEVELSRIPAAESSATPLVILEAATVRVGQTGRVILDNISLELFPASFTFIIGPVGCGKSTLLRAIIGDVRLTDGRRSLSAAFKDFGFCAQDTWLPNDTVKNIVLGPASFEEVWYVSVIQACALTNDIACFPLGDDTVVGSNGYSLSGGQRQRLALARALYSRKKILVLDDITSGLDIDSSKRIVNGLETICRQQGLAVILATHAVHHLHYADHIVALGQNGRLIEQGSLAVLMNSHDGNVRNLGLTKEYGTAGKPDVHAVVREPLVAHEADGDAQAELARRTGDMSVYKHYTASIGWKLGSIIILTAISFAFGRKFPELWVRWWSEDADSQSPRHAPALWVGIYFLVGLVSIASVFAHLWTFLVWTIPQSSAKLHEELLNSVMNAPYTFFLNSEAGVTLNRFANDMSLIDLDLAGGVVQTLLGSGVCIGAAVLIAAGAEYAGLTIPPVIAILYMIQRFYLRTSRQLRFMDLEAQAPLLSHFHETLAGVTTIRAFHWQRHWHQRCLHLVDRSQRPYYLLLCIQRWLNLVLDLVTAGVATVVVTLAITMRHTASSGSVGVSLLNILSFNTQMSNLIVAWTALETSLGAVARCKNFGLTTSSEHLAEETIEPPANWPPNGQLRLAAITAAYSAGIPVLQDITLSIPAGTKVGICGRSGSGKSSLLLMLFRMLDPSCGTIEVDDVDLATLPRAVTRSRFTALPQDALCLPGSVRMNLDPMQAHDVHEMSSALLKVGLLDLVVARGGLDSKMDDLGLSQGEMQLFALARALLRPSKLLVFDEMTSAVDGNTEENMMEVIQKEFEDSTVIVVAHRLNTIVGFDMLVVLDNGRLVECGSPQELLAKERGFFKGMWESRA